MNQSFNSSTLWIVHSSCLWGSLTCCCAACTHVLVVALEGSMQCVPYHTVSASPTPGCCVLHGQLALRRFWSHQAGAFSECNNAVQTVLTLSECINIVRVYQHRQSVSTSSECSNIVRVYQHRQSVSTSSDLKNIVTV